MADEVRVVGNRTIIPFADWNNTSFSRIKSAMENLERTDLPKSSLDAIKNSLAGNIRNLFKTYMFKDFFRLCPINGDAYYREEDKSVYVHPEAYKIRKAGFVLADPNLNLRLEGKEKTDLSVRLAFSGPVADLPVFRDLLQITNLTGRYQMTSDLANPSSSRITLFVTPLTEGAFFLQSAKAIYEKIGFDKLNDPELNGLRTEDFRGNYDFAGKEINSIARGAYAKGLLKLLGVELK